MGQHAQAIREKHTARNVTLIVLAVLIVPSLEVGNISYKLVQRLGHADAVGPILQGIACPVNDLSRGCSIEDVYRMIAITANQAIAAKANK